MLTNEQKEQIMRFANTHDQKTLGVTATKEAWDKYFKTYTDGADYLMDGEGFVFFEEKPDHIFIKDFISFGEGLGLMNKLKSKNKPLFGLVHLDNIEVLNVALRRFKFKIEKMVGNQYLIRR